MSDLRFEIDVKAISDQFKDLKKEVETDLQKATESLATMTHAKVLELSRDNLKSLHKTYSDNLEFTNPEKNFWIVTLKEPAMFIEMGRKSGFMQELLDVNKPGSSPTKTNKKGEKYRAIPFKHNKNPSEQSSTAQSLANEIKKVFKQKGIYWRKIETDESGSPRLGKIHSFNVESARLSPKHKTPATYGVSVFQTQDESGKVRKDIMTFRVISEKHKKEGKWYHPGMKGAFLFEKAYAWAEKEWENNILPNILSQYEK